MMKLMLVHSSVKAQGGNPLKAASILRNNFSCTGCEGKASGLGEVPLGKALHLSEGKTPNIYNGCRKSILVRVNTWNGKNH